MEKKLEVKDLRISFRTPAGKVQAVRNISFDLYKGETLAIVGESGSGKSVTNKAIIGISSGNAIVESGEIIYDGQDLLKITEDDFHKIRGDKIAMIFQDPLSSLNPIMKVGKQLTEAMLLKNKSSQKNARNAFNTELKLINQTLNTLTDDKDVIKSNNEKCKMFDSFCINSCKLESVYNEKVRVALELKSEIDDAIFMLDNKQSINDIKLYSRVLKEYKKALHPYVLYVNERFENDLNVIKAASKKAKGYITKFNDDVKNALIDISTILESSTTREKPNYFRLGFYIMKNPTFDYTSIKDISELNQMTLDYLNQNFMDDFIETISKAIDHNHNTKLELKKDMINDLDKAIELFSNTDFNKKEAYQTIYSLSKKVNNSIDKLEIVKNSKEYTFKSSIKYALDKYYYGIKNNPKEEKRFNKQQKKYDKLISLNKTPDWKIVPKAIIDLDIQRNNIVVILNNIKNDFNKQIENNKSFDPKKTSIDIIDFFKEKASNVVYNVTPTIAKMKALKLLEEVGISNSRARFKQYPFELSGGMRQRIVIAIALAANPDILICDEPTTALDVTIQSQILELINKLKVERNLSVIFITHDLGVVANMADRIAVMYAGKIVEYGTSDDVFYDPKHPYTWALLSSMPDLDTKEKLEAIPGTPPNMIYPPKGDAFAQRNRYALAIDFEEEPPLFEVNDHHKAATWLLHPKAPKVNPPKIVTERIERMKEREGLK